MKLVKNIAGMLTVSVVCLGAFSALSNLPAEKPNVETTIGHPGEPPYVTKADIDHTFSDLESERTFLHGVEIMGFPEYKKCVENEDYKVFELRNHDIMHGKEKSQDLYMNMIGKNEKVACGERDSFYHKKWLELRKNGTL